MRWERGRWPEDQVLWHGERDLVGLHRLRRLGVGSARRAEVLIWIWIARDGSEFGDAADESTAKAAAERCGRRLLRTADEQAALPFALPDHEETNGPQRAASRGR